MTDKKILFIEDDPDQLMIYESKFSLEGFLMVTAAEGEQGIKLARQEKPVVVLLDLLLRNENGLDILKKLKQDPETKDIPVIVFTNFDTQDSKEQAKKLGALEYIVKTQLTPGEMVEKVKKLINLNS